MGDRLRLGMIGCGRIAEFHVAAFRAAGFVPTTVCSSDGSERPREFAKRHGIDRPFEGVKELLAARDMWDALLIAVPVEETLNVLELALATGAPILVEKPVAYASRYLDSLVESGGPVIVAYNRRFYGPALRARAEVAEEPPMLAHLELPESITAPKAGLGGRQYLRPFLANSVHGLDLTSFVLGPLRVAHVSRATDAFGGIIGLAAVLETEAGVPVQLTCNWRAPANFSLTVDWPGRRLQLKPFEKGLVYEGMEVVEPTPESPIRTYHPKLVEDMPMETLDVDFKPGFVAQAEALGRLVREGRIPDGAATLTDARAVLALAEQILGDPIE